jgi:hypothetical protein
VLLRFWTLTDGAGGFLPGVPLGFGCLGLGIKLRPRPPGVALLREGRGCVRFGNLTHQASARSCDGVPIAIAGAIFVLSFA